MALPKAEFRRRLLAGLELHGMKITDLQQPLIDHGLGKHAAARAGHDSDEAVPSRALILALSEILELPPEWFEAEDWRPLVRSSERAAAESPATKLDIAALREELLAGVARELAVRDAQRKQPEPGDLGEGLTGG